MPAVVLALCFGLAALAQTQDADAGRFFEMKIRPLLDAKCFACHAGAQPQSGLLLSTRDNVLRGGNRGPAAIPGKSDHSRIIAAVEQTGDLKMPPAGKLKPAEIEDLKRWIDLGLPWPSARPATAANRASNNHWAFQPPRTQPPPSVRQAAWVKNPIDAFMLARLEREQIAPSPEADRATLIRRLSLDLLGLPPSPGEVDQFLADKRPDAYERLVDHLLASPHYGERWGRHWLDAARYADTNGFGFDRARYVWRYRDWVIGAHNRDLPFDQFVIEQIAGDLLESATADQKIATGFHRNTMINEEGGVDQEQYRIEAVFDRVATTGAVFLGLTLGCAQCHGHKYDPISQREFYQLFAFYNNQDEQALRVVPAGEAYGYRQTAAKFALDRNRLQGRMAEYNTRLMERMSSWERSLTAAERAKLPGNVRAILDVPAERRAVEQIEDLEKHYKEYDAAWQALVQESEVLNESPHSGNPAHYTTLALAERDKPRVTRALIRGDFLKPGVEVTPGVPAVLPPLETHSGVTPNRLNLARWIVSEKNPLTARVTMNRVWQQYFGRGLVRTTEDFGTQGDPPTHPEMLDWLATEFVRQKWSLKAMHRLITTSATYRQSSRVTPALAQRDPENILLARAPRWRVEAEIVRDIALTASGLLHHRIGGPSVFPPQPLGVTDLSRGNLPWIAATGPDRYRRGLYTFWKRTSPYPVLTAFDMPSFEVSVVRRTRSNTPMQALTTLNEELFVECAQAMAGRLLKEVPGDDRARLRHAFRLVVAREPDAAERDLLSTALQKELSRSRSHAGAPAEDAAQRRAAWFAIARIVLNLDEAITRE